MGRRVKKISFPHRCMSILFENFRLKPSFESGFFYDDENRISTSRVLMAIVSKRKSKIVFTYKTKLKKGDIHVIFITMHVQSPKGQIGKTFSTTMSSLYGNIDILAQWKAFFEHNVFETVGPNFFKVRTKQCLEDNFRNPGYQPRILKLKNFNESEDEDGDEEEDKNDVCSDEESPEEKISAS